ncbi:hypothetical protein AC579_2640 [Pseudocercospora musae]|uniref:Uncharacterized protein n=1 Tax=Pseudocercospora musae TaxID=113226 RepID=A0A139IGI8_9PEZI|nr:hypothetical protein AC579_2640 [Pseudocercospora musae]
MLTALDLLLLVICAATSQAGPLVRPRYVNTTSSSKLPGSTISTTTPFAFYSAENSASSIRAAHDESGSSAAQTTSPASGPRPSPTLPTYDSNSTARVSRSISQSTSDGQLYSFSYDPVSMTSCASSTASTYPTTPASNTSLVYSYAPSQPQPSSSATQTYATTTTSAAAANSTLPQSTTILTLYTTLHTYKGAAAPSSALSSSSSADTLAGPYGGTSSTTLTPYTTLHVSSVRSAATSEQSSEPRSMSISAYSGFAAESSLSTASSSSSISNPSHCSSSVDASTTTSGTATTSPEASQPASSIPTSFVYSPESSSSPNSIPEASSTTSMLPPTTQQPSGLPHVVTQSPATASRTASASYSALPGITIIPVNPNAQSSSSQNAITVTVTVTDPGATTTVGEKTITVPARDLVYILIARFLAMLDGFGECKSLVTASGSDIHRRSVHLTSITVNQTIFCLICTANSLLPALFLAILRIMLNCVLSLGRKIDDFSSRHATLPSDIHHHQDSSGVIMEMDAAAYPANDDIQGDYRACIERSEQDQSWSKAWKKAYIAELDITADRLTKEIQPFSTHQPRTNSKSSLRLPAAAAMLLTGHSETLHDAQPVLPEQDGKEPFVCIRFLLTDVKAPEWASSNMQRQSPSRWGPNDCAWTLDCWNGNDRKLVGYYEKHGSVSLGDVSHDDWPSAVLELRLD